MEKGLSRTQKTVTKAVKPYRDCILEMLLLFRGIHQDRLLSIACKHGLVEFIPEIARVVTEERKQVKRTTEAIEAEGRENALKALYGQPRS